MNFNGTTVVATADNADFLQVHKGGSAGTRDNAVIRTGGLIFDTNGHAVTIANVLGDYTGETGTLTKTGTGTLTLSSANTYTGTTSINSGTLALAGGSAIVDTGVVNIANTAGATLQVNASETIGTLSGGGTSGGTVNLSAGTLTFGNATSGTFAGTISGGGALTKAGVGAFILSGTTDYTGATTVNAGTLTLSGTRSAASGAITVANAAATSATLEIQNGTYALGGNAFSVGNVSGATGTVNQSGGAVTFSGGNQFLIGAAGGSGNVGVYNLSGGSITITNGGNRGITLGVNPSAQGTFNLSGSGTLTMTNNMLQIGRSDYGANNTTNVFSQTGGTASVSTLAMGGNGTTSTGVASTLTLTGGTFSASAFTLLAAGNTNTAVINIGGTADVTLPALPTTRGTSSTVTLNFDGGTLRPSAASTTYISGLTNAFIKAGGANFDVASGKDITIPQNLLTDGTSTGGGLTKAGVGTLTLSGSNSYSGGTTVSSGVLQIGGAGRLGGGNYAGAITDNASFIFNTSADQTLSGVISGTGSLSQTGSGVLILTNPTNNYSGGTTIASGTLSFANGALSSSGNSTVSAGTLQWSAGNTQDISARLILQNSGSATLDTNGNNVTMATGFGGSSSSSLTKAGSGTLALTGSNSYSGGTTINAGTLQLGDGISNTVVPMGTVTVNAGATLEVNLANSGTFGGGIFNYGTVNLTNSGTNTISGNLGGWVGTAINQTGTGTTILSGNNTYFGTVNINAGTVQLNYFYAGAGSTMNIGVPNGLTFDVTAATIGGLSGSNGITLITTSGSGVNLSIGYSNLDSTYPGVISGTASTSALTKVGNGALTLSGSNTYAGTTTVSGGTLTLSGMRSAASGAITVASVTGTNATLEIQSGTYALGSNNFQVGASTNATGTVNQSGGAVSFTGGTELLIGAAGTGSVGVYNLSGGSITTANGSVGLGILLGVNNGAIGGTFNLSGSGSLTVGGGSTLYIGRADWSGSADNTTNLFNQTGGTATVNTLSMGGRVGGSSGVASTLTLTGGTFSASAFTNLAVGNTNTAVINIGGTADVTLPAFPTVRGTSSTAALNFDGGTLRPSVASTTYISGLTNAFIKAGGANFDVATGKDITITQELLTDATSVGGGLTKAGVGALTLAGTNTYTGATTISAGTLSVGATGNLGGASADNALIFDGGTLQVTGTTMTDFGSHTPSFNATKAVGLDISNAANTFTVSQVLNQTSGGLTKAGAGTLILSAANTYSGDTTVNAGTLTLSGARSAASGAITVANTASTNATLAIQSGTYALGSNNFQVGANTNATGTVNQSGGAVTFSGGNELLIGAAGGSGYVGIYNLSGGSITTANGAFHLGVLLGVNNGAQAIFNLSRSGSLTVLGSNNALQIGRSDHGANNTTNVFNQTGGTANVSTLIMGGNGTTSTGVASTLTLTSGTFSASAFTLLAAGNTNTAVINIGGTADVTLPALPTTRGTSSTVTLNFDGGTLRPSAASTTYISGLTNAFIKAGGANFDVATGKDITIPQNLLTDGTSTGGGLTKAGVGTLTLSGSNSYTGGTTLNSGTLRVGNANALGTGGLTVNAGTLDLNGNSIAVLTLGGSGGTVTNLASGTSTLTTTVASGTSTYAGNIANGTGGAVALTKEGAGKLVLSGSLSMAGLTANSGVVELAQSGSIGAVTVSGSGAMALTAHSGSTYTVLDTSSLSITSGGSIDLWNNALILRASGTSENATNLTAVKASVNAASDGLKWDGVGLGSTTAYNEAQPTHTQALALMVYDNSVIKQGSFEGVSGLGYFDGETPVGFNQVLVKLTYLGDFNADGIVNASDYTWLDGFALGGNVLGDLNGDGLVNATDYTWLDGSALNQSFGVLAEVTPDGSASHPYQAALAACTGAVPASPEAVPEPGSLGLLLAGALGLLGLRRKAKGASRA